MIRETPVGYALLKAKSSKILKKDHFKPEDDTAENICSLYVPDWTSSPTIAHLIGLEVGHCLHNFLQSQTQRISSF